MVIRTVAPVVFGYTSACLRNMLRPSSELRRSWNLNGLFGDKGQTKGTVQSEPRDDRRWSYTKAWRKEPFSGQQG
jgi:hypothetical protein